jgi:hypothetical protein
MTDRASNRVVMRLTGTPETQAGTGLAKMLPVRNRLGVMP